MLRCLVTLAVLAAAPTLAGCAPPPRDPAVVAYEALFTALVRGDGAAVVALLGPRTRLALAAGVGLEASATAEATIERLAIRPDWTFTVDQAQRARLATEPAAGESRVVIAALADRTWAIPVVEVDGNWRVELLDATLHEASTGP